MKSEESLGGGGGTPNKCKLISNGVIYVSLHSKLMAFYFWQSDEALSKEA